MSDYILKFEKLKVGSCTCSTKTPDEEYHKWNCNYRVLCELESQIATLQKAVPDLETTKAAWAIYHGQKELSWQESWDKAVALLQEQAE